MSLSSPFSYMLPFSLGSALLTAAFSVADNYGLLDRVKKSRATRRVRRHARRVLSHAASRTRSAKSVTPT